MAFISDNWIPGLTQSNPPIEAIADTVSNQLTWFIVTDSKYGAKGDGRDDTSSVVAAYNAAVVAGGGVIYFPRRGLYRFNLTVTHNNIVLVGCGVRDVNNSTTIGFAPWDTSRPVIQVGNDTGIVNGFGLRDTAIFGQRNNVDCPACIYLAGGCHGADITFVQCINGIDTLKMKTGSSYPCTLNVISHSHFWEGFNSTVFADNTHSVSPDSFTTANRLIGCYVNGANTTGYAIRVYKGNAVDFVATYVDASPDHCYYSFEGGSSRFSVCTLDNGSNTLNGVTIEWTTPNAVHDLGRYVMGHVRVTGEVKWIDSNGTTPVPLPAAGLDMLTPTGTVSSPYVVSPWYITTVDNPSRKEYTIDLSGSDGILTLAKTYGINQFKLAIAHADANIQLRAGNVGSFFLFDAPEVTNAAGNARFWAATNTSANCRIDVYKGDGSLDVNHTLTSKGDAYLCVTNGNLGIGINTPTSRLHVADTAGGVGLNIFPNNAAAISGGLTPGATYRTGGDPDHVCIVH